MSYNSLLWHTILNEILIIAERLLRVIYADYTA